MKKFILRSNLSKLAQWLRFIGHDVVCYRNISWEKINKIAQKERRIILTRNKRESNRKDCLYVSVLINSVDYLEQISEIKHLLTCDDENFFSRCSKCNEILTKTENLRFIQKNVPKKVFENYSEFRHCRMCGKIYWKGTQQQEIEKKFKKLFQ